jgi:Xaa-Pro dipeptidase
MVDAAYYDVAQAIRPGVSENELVALVHQRLYELGANWVEAVNCCSGPRTNPHHHDFSDRIIRPGDIVFMDIMNSFCGYRTCYYRTFCTGTPTREQADLYAECIKWLKDCITQIRPGATTADIANVWPGPEVLGCKTESEVLACQWGHGIGLSIWELPVISRAWSLEQPYPLKENMVFAVETYAGPPGVPFGIRIEDEVVVTADGCRLLTRFPEDELIACPI